MTEEEILDKFIEQEKEKLLVGSGDDMLYVNQMIKYVNKQRDFLIDLIKFVKDLEEKGK